MPLTKVTFEPLKGRRYRVRKNGVPVIRDGTWLVVNEASIAATRNALMNEGRTPPPPLPVFVRPGKPAVGFYSSMWDDTTFLCPWCKDSDFRPGRFSGPTTCRYCKQPAIVTQSQTSEPASAPNPLDGLFNASHHLL